LRIGGGEGPDTLNHARSRVQCPNDPRIRYVPHRFITSSSSAISQKPLSLKRPALFLYSKRLFLDLALLLQPHGLLNVKG
jgi:hypothetical protein